MIKSLKQQSFRRSCDVNTSKDQIKKRLSLYDIINQALQDKEEGKDPKNLFKMSFKVKNEGSQRKEKNKYKWFQIEIF